MFEQTKFCFWLLVSLTFGLFLFSEHSLADESELQIKEGQIKKSIQRVFEIQNAAWNKGDIETFMEYYWKSDKLTFSAGGKTTRGWNETLARYKKSYATKEQMGQLTFSKPEITVLGDSAALALGKWHLKRKMGDRQGNFSVVFQKIRGRWVIIHDHSSSLEKENQETEKESADKEERDKK